MNILGVNGWMKRGHDAAACLILNDKIVAVAEEERFIRKKHAFDTLPVNAVAYCLYAAGISSDEIDVISWGWNLPELYRLHGLRFMYKVMDLNDLIFPKKYYPRKKKVIPIEFVNHHYAHAVSVYCMRKSDDDMAIIVVDGAGEDVSASIFIGRHGKIKKIKSYPMIGSLGFFYEAACNYIGFSRTQAGKLMGLASYGQAYDEKFFSIVNREILVPFQDFVLSPKGILDWEDEIVRKWLKIFDSRWSNRLLVKHEYSHLSGKINSDFMPREKEENVAATIQKEFERLYSWLVEEAVRLTGVRNIAMAGGSVLNCSANGFVVGKYPSINFYFQPMANDAGTSLGAAVSMLASIPKSLFASPNLGPVFSADEIKQVLCRAKVNFFEPSNFYQEVASALASGAVVGWFDGRMESGPRALGARSILADPRNRKMHKIINDVKSREQWRPLAPSVLSNFYSEYFEGETPSPYMIIRSYVIPERMSDISAVVHVDGSVRPQVVQADMNPSYFRLIERFYSITGIPMLLNTSFNNEREPIVCTPVNALRTFFETGVDLLAMRPYVIRK